MVYTVLCEVMDLKIRIKEFAVLTGVSVRTLHYYDEIGLLRPAYVDSATGYRYYDEQSLLRMQEILFYRELDFPLQRIRNLLSSPHYNKKQALAEQKQLLILKKERLERLIAAIDSAAKGENVMTAFDNRDFEQYRAEAAARWGDTAAYREYEKKTASATAADEKELAIQMDGLMAQFATCMQTGATPDSAAAQVLVKALQEHITAHYYHCTDEILFGLGQMYVADDRFCANIDRHADGTAAFIRAAIETYCRK